MSATRSITTSTLQAQRRTTQASDGDSTSVRLLLPCSVSSGRYCLPCVFGSCACPLFFFAAFFIIFFLVERKKRVERRTQHQRKDPATAKGEKTEAGGCIARPVLQLISFFQKKKQKSAFGSLFLCCRPLFPPFFCSRGKEEEKNRRERRWIHLA